MLEHSLILAISFVSTDLKYIVVVNNLSDFNFVISISQKNCRTPMSFNLNFDVRIEMSH